MSPSGVYVRTKKRVYPRKPLAERFWPKVDQSGECWVWTGATGAGYGRIRRGSKTEPMPGAHVVAWELTNGPVPDGLLLCHSCDNPPCVRPDHLFLGTYADNMQDASRKGRMAHGAQHRAARLSEAQVVAIRAAYSSGGGNQHQLAAEYGMSQAAIWAVIHRASWRHIP